MDTEIVRRDVLTIDDAATIDQIADALTRLDTIRRVEREMRDALKAKMLAWILTNNQDITIGTTRYYAGYRKETTCRDKRLTLEAMLHATGGDFDVIAELLASEPFKAGAARGVLSPEQWDKCFEVENKSKLVEGKPVKEVLSADERFVGDKKPSMEITNED